jgi:hypothetical protein
MNKKNADEMTNDMLIADILLKVKGLMQLLVVKGVITVEELDKEMNSIVEQVSKDILSKNKQ